jgi:hypothetical protein
MRGEERNVTWDTKSHIENGLVSLSLTRLT